MYRLLTFGRLKIEREGVSLDDVGISRKALAILAILAAQGSASRERLMALLWSESDSDRARGSLNQALHLLRRQLGHHDLLLGSAELRLNPALIDSDVGLFLSALGDDPSTAIRHYAGSFLEGVHLDGASEFERWASARSTELAQLHVDALERLASDAEGRGAFPEAVQFWRRYQIIDPLNGRVATRLMGALASSGDLPGALRHAQFHQMRLQKEWDIGPDPDVSSLAERLRSGAHAEDRLSTPHPPIAPLQGARLHDSQQTGVVASDPARPRFSRPWYLIPIAVFLLVIVAGVVVLMNERDDRSNGAAPTADTTPVAGSIAVLPFEDLSPGQDQEYFSNGMTEELITLLAKLDGLHVAARTSSFRFRGAGADVQSVRQSLGVAHVLLGSVRRVGDQVRVSVQLVDTATGFQVWSETYNRTSNDFFTLQSEISGAIIETLQIRLTDREGERLSAAPTSDFEAYEMYLKGLHFFGQLQIPPAIEYLTAATNRDSTFARAFASLAEAYAVPAAYSDRSPHDIREWGVQAAEEALRLDPNLADAHFAMGWLEMIGLRWEEAGRSFRHAVTLDGRAPRARFYHGVYLHRRGMLDEALAELEQARRLDPLSPSINAIYASVLSDLGRTDAAVEHLEATLELAPDFPIAHAILGHVHLGAGRSTEAILHYEWVASLVPSSFYAGFLGHAYARAGHLEAARRILDDMTARAERGEYVSSGAIGWILLGLDEKSEGYGHLQTAVGQRDVFLTMYGLLANRSLSAPFDGDPRFQQLRRSAGMVE